MKKIDEDEAGGLDQDGDDGNDDVKSNSNISTNLDERIACKPISESVTIHELQKRLESRNALLDVVRKAYHRDVLVVKHHLQLKEAEKGEENISIDQRKVLSTLSTASLSSVPSIDLRHEGLHLFSPQQCELRLHPCPTCGGQYEVIHRESSRYTSLLRCRDDLLEKICGLEEDLAETNQRVLDGRKELQVFQSQTQQKNNEYKIEIDRLKTHAATFDNLKKLSEDQKKEISILSTVQQEKVKLEEAMELLRRDLLHEKIQNAELLKKLQDNKNRITSLELKIQDGLKREQTNKEDIERLEMKNGELEHDASINKQRLLKLDVDLTKSQMEVEQSKRTIHVIESEAISKQEDLKSAVLHREKTIEELTTAIHECREGIQGLNTRLGEEQNDHNHYRAQMTQRLQNCEIEAKHRAEKHKVENLVLSNRVAYLMTLSSSFIQNLYEQCLTQEMMISLEDPSFLSKHNKNKFYRSKTVTNKNNVNLVIARLDNKIESMHIDWEGILRDDDDRRIIYGNLNNRLQSNNSQIDNLIKRIHIQTKREVEYLQQNNNEAIHKLTSSHKAEISALKRDIENIQRRLKDSNSTLTLTQEDLSAAKDKIGYLNNCIKIGDVKIAGLENDLIKSRLSTEELQNELSMVKINLQKANDMIEVKNDEIKDQNDTLSQLEVILEKTTNRFALKLEEERRRLDTNVDIGVQVTKLMMDFCQQADFLPITNQGCKVDIQNTRKNMKAHMLQLKH